MLKRDFLLKGRGRRHLVAALVAAALSSFLYIVANWYWFYGTAGQRKFYESQAYFAALEKIFVLSENDPKQVDHVHSFLSRLDPQAKIQVIKYDQDKPLWSTDSEHRFNEKRTIIHNERTFEFNGYMYHMEYTFGNRPGIGISLLRAWSWSIIDFMKDAESWWKFDLYRRSVPLFMYWLTLWPAFYYLFKDVQFNRIRVRKLRNSIGASQKDISQKQEELLNLQKQAELKDKQISMRTKEIQRMKWQLKTAKREKEKSKKDSHKHGHLSMDLTKDLAETEHFLELAEKEQGKLKQEKDDLELEKLIIEEEIQRFQENLKRLEGAYSRKGADLIEYLIALSKEGVDEDAKLLKKLVEQLQQWVRISKNEKVTINIADHHSKDTIQRAIDRIDKVFLNKYFVLVRSEKYAPRDRKTIKITVNDSKKQDYSGILSVNLDHDAGYSFALAYNTRGKGTSKNAGFLLALLLKMNCKEFSDFEIKT